MHKKRIRPIARLHGYWLWRRWLPALQGLSGEQRRAWVFERLKRTLTLAAEGVPFYRERFRQAGFDPARHFQSPDDLSRIPLLSKDDVRDNYERLLDRRFLRGSVVANTSGTTGQPMTMRLSEWYVALDYACMFRHWAKAGYTFRAPYAALRSYVPDKPGGPLWMYNWWQNTLYMSAYHLKPANARAYIDALLRFRPAFLRGYPSSVSALAEFAWPQREQLGFVRGIFTASETLTALERQTIERTFGPKLYDWYGMTEPAVVMTERADHAGLEVNWEYGFPEFLDGEELAPGERRLVATSLHNPVMPFIRYDTEDLVCPAETMDDAGLYPRIDAVLGRKDECLLTSAGGRLPSLNFYSLLQTCTDILRFQFVQTSISQVTLKLSLRPEKKHSPALLEQVRGEVEKRLGPEMVLTLEVTDHFLTSPDGKTPTFKRAFMPRAVHAPAGVAAG
jgi:phenylacetate-CoA ligase